MTQLKSLSINKILKLVDINWCRRSNSNALAVSKSIISVSTARYSAWAATVFLAKNGMKRLLSLIVLCQNSYKSWSVLFDSQREEEKKACTQMKSVSPYV